MARYYLEFKWTYEKKIWEQLLYIGDEVHVLANLNDLGTYLEMPFTGMLDGTIYMGSAAGDGAWSVILSASVSYDQDTQMWKAAAGSEGGVIPDFAEAVKLALQLTGDGFPAEILPSWKLKKIQGSYQVGEDLSMDDLTAEMTIDGVWDLFAGLSFGYPGLMVYLQGGYGSLAFTGSVLMEDEELKFRLAYGYDRLYLSAVSTPAELPSLADFGKPFGIDLSEYFPDEILHLGELTLEELDIVLPLDLSCLDRLCFHVTMTRPLVLFGLESLTLSEVGVFYDGRQIGTSQSYDTLELFGTLKYEEEELTLSALKYGTGGGWKFTGSLINREQYGIMSLWELLSMGEAPAVLQDLLVPVSVLETVYDMGKSSFSIHAWFVNDNEIYFEADGSAAPVRYQAGISIAPELTLSMLPVVGENLHIFDGSVLSGIGLQYVSGEGLTLSGALKVLDYNFPFVLQLYRCLDETGMGNRDSVFEDADSVMWIHPDLELGVLSLPRIGLGYAEGKLLFGVDASVKCAGLIIRCLDLLVGIDMADFRNVEFSLGGMELAYISGSFSLGGSLRKSSEQPLEYDGSLLVHAGDISIKVIGGYSEKEDVPSIFAYGILRKMIGGPPAFYITGLAAGFGYQRSLILPELDSVSEFPLIRMVFETGNEAELIRLLKEQYTQAAADTLWIAAGISFTSFKMVDSFALLTVETGKRLEVSVLGEGRMFLGDIARAVLNLKARLCPEEGVFSLEAALSDDSYIFSKRCRLTGGFAFYVWFGGEHKGDFVLSLGGYHDTFRRPSYYPAVDRLGFTWVVDQAGHLIFSGGLYFALTPSCIMAGGGIDARYENGALKAWFYARADFIMYWRPFYYQIEITAGLGASYRVDCLFVHHTFTIELAASLRLWGPEFSGKVHVKWWIISFTISFGEAEENLCYLTWDEFLEQCLTSDEGRTDGSEEYASVSVASGLLDETEDEEECKASLVQSSEVKLLLHTQIPNQTIRIGCTERGAAVCSSQTELYILPMGGSSLQCETVVQIEKKTAAGWRTEEKNIFGISGQYEDLPAAMWGNKLSENDTLIKGALTGILLEPEAVEYYCFPPEAPLDLDRMAEGEAVRKMWEAIEPSQFIIMETAAQANKEFSETAMDEESVSIRKQLFEWFESGGIVPEGNGEIRTLAREAENLFTEQIVFCHDEERSVQA